MSTDPDTGTAVGRAGTEAVGKLPGRKYLVLVVLGIGFWTWLLARWTYDRVIAPGVAVRHREPLLPAGPFESASETLSSVAEDLGVVGIPIDWLAWLAGLAAFAIESMPALAAGAWITVQLTVASIVLGFLIAVPLAVMRVYAARPFQWLALVYTELIRGTPILAQLFVLWFGLRLGGYVTHLPGVGGPLPDEAVVVAIVGFTINSSAYQSEYIRSALTSVDPGQLQAARSIGLSKFGGIRHVVLPQALRFAIPGWTNEFIYLIKYSSLAAFIAVPELFRQARSIGSDTFQFTDIYLIAALFYLALVLTTAAIMTKVEERTTIPGLGQ